jgi:hypothetical protein
MATKMAKRSVYIGSDGSTPKKEQSFFRFDAPEQVGIDSREAEAQKQAGKKKVSGFDVPGQTPTKTQTFFKEDAPEQVGLDRQRAAAPSKKRVQLGVEGDTPKKVAHYERAAAPWETVRASPSRTLPARTVLTATSKYPDPPAADPFASPPPSDRPKTSRGKARPSPDEFTDYVVSPQPSPQRELGLPPQFMSFLEEGDSGDELEDGGDCEDDCYGRTEPESFGVDDDSSSSSSSSSDGVESGGGGGHDSEEDSRAAKVHPYYQPAHVQSAGPAGSAGSAAAGTYPVRDREQLSVMVMAILGVSLLA